MTSAISKNYSRAKKPGNVQKNPAKTAAALARAGRRANAEIRVFADHVPLGLYTRFLPATTRYMTVLRDPVDRVLSHYHFHARAGERKLALIWEQFSELERVERESSSEEPPAEIVQGTPTDFSLEEGLARKIPIYNNLATRFLCGRASLFGELPSDAAERAKENISSFAFVGVTERLDESIILLGRMLGLGLMPYYLRHVNQGRPALEDTPAELRELVAEHNAADIELYRFARERFDVAADGAGDLASAVAELRRRSAEVTEVAAKEQAAKKEAGQESRKAKKAARRAAESEGSSTPGRRRARQPLSKEQRRTGAVAIEQRIDALEDRLAGLESMLAAATNGRKSEDTGSGPATDPPAAT